MEVFEEAFSSVGEELNGVCGGGGGGEEEREGAGGGGEETHCVVYAAEMRRRGRRGEVGPWVATDGAVAGEVF